MSHATTAHELCVYIAKQLLYKNTIDLSPLESRILGGLASLGYIVIEGGVIREGGHLRGINDSSH